LLVDEGQVLVFDLDGCRLRISRVDELRPQPFPVIAWRVDSLAAYVHDLAARGVNVDRVASSTELNHGTRVASGGAHFALLRDPDGNTITVSGD